MFFCKQKTAYEKRISDWSSDVCSSDLFRDSAGIRQFLERPPRGNRRDRLEYHRHVMQFMVAKDAPVPDIDAHRSQRPVSPNFDNVALQRGGRRDARQMRVQCFGERGIADFRQRSLCPQSAAVAARLGKADLMPQPLRLMGNDASAVITAPLESLCAILRPRSEEHTSELQSLMRISYAVFCLKKNNNQTPH